MIVNGLVRLRSNQNVLQILRYNEDYNNESPKATNSNCLHCICIQIPNNEEWQVQQMADNLS